MNRKMVIVGSVALAAMIAAAAPAHAQFTMKLSSPTINEVSHEWMKAMKAGVEQRSGGKIKVEMYPANQLGQLPATIDGVALGTIELTLPAVGFVVGLEPRFQVFDAAGLFDSIEHAQRVFGDPDVRKRLAGFGANKGVEPLVTFCNGPMMLLSHKAVRRLSDFKGQKIRAPGGAPIQMEPFKRLGALPLSISLGEALPAMQNRAIDGVTGGFAIFTSFKYFDVAKGLTQLPGSYLIATGLVNRKWMQSLGPDLEAMVRDESRRHEVLFSTWGVEDIGRVTATWKENGGEMISLSPADQKEYLTEVTASASAILNANPQLREDYQAILAAAKKHRR
jgi:TRAP-type C4-dicarboxylate transport system substrate-binding protein